MQLLRNARHVKILAVLLAMLLAPISAQLVLKDMFLTARHATLVPLAVLNVEAEHAQLAMPTIISLLPVPPLVPNVLTKPTLQLTINLLLA